MAEKLMTNPFEISNPIRVKLTCLNNGDTETLYNYPLWSEVLFMAVVEAAKSKTPIKEDFETYLIFHDLGGGYDFAEKVVRTFDINGTIELQLIYLEDGRQTGPPLFTGHLQLYTYHAQGRFIKLLLKPT